MCFVLSRRARLTSCRGRERLAPPSSCIESSFEEFVRGRRLGLSRAESKNIFWKMEKDPISCFI